MTVQTTNPFQRGYEDRMKGITSSDKRCPYPRHSREWVRYVSGQQAAINDQRKAQAQKQEAQPCHQ